MLGRLHGLPLKNLVEMRGKIKRDDPVSFHSAGNMIGLNASLGCECAEGEVLVGESLQFGPGNKLGVASLPSVPVRGCAPPRSAT